VVQEAVLRAFRGFDALRGSDAKAWLLAIVRNCHFTAAKQQQRRALVPLPEENDEVDGHAMVGDYARSGDDSILSDSEKGARTALGLAAGGAPHRIDVREIEEMDYAQHCTLSPMSDRHGMSRARSPRRPQAKWVAGGSGRRAACSGAESTSGAGFISMAKVGRDLRRGDRAARPILQRVPRACSGPPEKVRHRLAPGRFLRRRAAQAARSDLRALDQEDTAIQAREAPPAKSRTHGLRSFEGALFGRGAFSGIGAPRLQRPWCFSGAARCVESVDHDW